MRRIVDAEGNATDFFYHDNLALPTRSGLLARIVDARGNETEYGQPAPAIRRGYDVSGFPEKIEDARTNPAEFEFDFLGRITKTTDRTLRDWEDTFDLRGNRLSSKDPQSNTIRYCYDQNDNLTLVVPARAGQAPVCNAAGEDTDVNGGVLDGTDGYSTKLTYDARDLPETTLATSLSTASPENLESAGAKKTEFEYYADGQLKIVREPRRFNASSGAPLTGNDFEVMQETLYEYYWNNRLKKVSGPVLPGDERAQTTAVYDERGLPVKVVEPKSSGTAGATVTYAYNGPGQVTSVKIGSLAPTTYAYNAFGDRITMTTPEGQGKYSTTYTPDKLGRTVTITRPPARAADDASAENWQKQPTSIVYDYDGVGNVESIEQPTGPGGSTKVFYTYWENNLLKSETDPFENSAAAQHVVTYDYDEEGRQTARVDKNGSAEVRRTEWAYYEDGTVKFETSTGAGLTPHRSFFEYDVDNNLTVVKTADNYNGVPESPVAPNISEIANTYTTQGELEKVTEAIYPPGTTTPVVKTSTFEWQRDGVIKRHSLDGQASTFQHRLDRLETGFTPFNGDGSFTATWFDNASLDTLQMPNGARVTNGYDGVSRLEQRRVEVGSTMLSAWSGIEYDDNGNRLSEITSQRKPDGSEAPDTRTGTATYRFDQLDRLIAHHHPFDGGDTKVGYQLDDAGNVLSEQALDGPALDIQGFAETTFSYTNNRLSARTSAGDTLGYEHDGSGNQTFEGTGIPQTPVGTANGYDAASHPQKTTTPEGNWAEYRYDGLGRLATRNTDDGQTTLFFHFGLVDQVAVEQSTGGTEYPKTTRYLLNSSGAPLGQQVTRHAGPDVVTSSYFVPDLRGNLSQLLGSDLGSTYGVKGIFGYDAYGKAKQDLDDTSGKPTDGSLTKLAQGFDSRLRYQMAPHDPLTGNYNLGPRLLNPNINRFVGADFYAAGAANLALQVDPLTGNRYLYAGANPAGLIDDGHSPFEVPCWVKKIFGRNCEQPKPVKLITDACVVPGEAMEALDDEEHRTVRMVCLTEQVVARPVVMPNGTVTTVVRKEAVPFSEPESSGGRDPDAEKFLRERPTVTKAVGKDAAKKVTDILGNKSSLSELTMEQRLAAASVYRWVAANTKHKNAYWGRLFNIARAEFLEGTRPFVEATLEEFKKAHGA